MTWPTLRSLQDWHLRYALESVKGVAEVAPVGGFVKEYQVDLDPNKLLAYGIPIGDVVNAIRMSQRRRGRENFRSFGPPNIMCADAATSRTSTTFENIVAES